MSNPNRIFPIIAKSPILWGCLASAGVLHHLPPQPTEADSVYRFVYGDVFHGPSDRIHHDDDVLHWAGGAGVQGVGSHRAISAARRVELAPGSDSPGRPTGFGLRVVVGPARRAVRVASEQSARASASRDARAGATVQLGRRTRRGVEVSGRPGRGPALRELRPVSRGHLGDSHSRILGNGRRHRDGHRRPEAQRHRGVAAGDDRRAERGVRHDQPVAHLVDHSDVRQVRRRPGGDPPDDPGRSLGRTTSCWGVSRWFRRGPTASWPRCGG